MKIKIYYDKDGTVRVTKQMSGNIENTVIRLEKGESVELDIQAQVGYKMKKSK